MTHVKNQTDILDILKVPIKEDLEFKKFFIEIKNMSPRKKQPHPFIPKVGKLGLARLLIKEILILNIKLFINKRFWEVLLSRPCIYGVFSGHLGGFRPRKEKCTGCYRCVLEYPSFCEIERNPEYLIYPDSYWTDSNSKSFAYNPIATINYESETGRIPIKGMGYKGLFSGKGWDSMWTDMSEIVRPTRDGVHGREYISTVVDLGRKLEFLEFNGFELNVTTNVKQTSLPIIFDYLPENLNSESIRRSIRLAAEQINIYYYEQISKIEKDRFQNLTNVIPIVELKDIKPYAEQISQAEILSFSDSEEEIYQELRKLNSEAILISRMPLQTDAKRLILRNMAKGIDCIHLIASYHGLESGGSRFIKESLRDIHTFLVNKGVRDQITLIASGGIILAEHVPKAIICGADLVAIDTTILVALQTEFLGECTSIETGAIIKEDFSVEWGSQRLINLLGSWHAQLIEVLSAMGIRDVRRLRGDIGRAIFNEELEKEVFGDIDRVY